MKKYGKMTKAELIRRLEALEQGAPAASSASEHERLLHELQVHQIELETQNTELREAQLLMEDSRDRYANLYDQALFGCLTLSAKGEIRDINLTAAAMLGVERSRLEGVPFHRHVAREDLARFREHLQRLSDESSAVELRLAPKNGGTLPILMQSRLVFDAEKQGFVCRTTLTDITARQQFEQAQAQAARAFAEAVGETVRHPLLVLDGDLRVKTANHAFCQLFQVRREETENRFIHNLGPVQWDVAKLRELLEEILPKHSHFENFEVDADFPGAGRKKLVLHARRVLDEAQKTQWILLAIEEAKG